VKLAPFKWGNNLISIVFTRILSFFFEELAIYKTLFRKVPAKFKYLPLQSAGKCIDELCAIHQLLTWLLIEVAIIITTISRTKDRTPINISFFRLAFDWYFKAFFVS